MGPANPKLHNWRKTRVPKRSAWSLAPTSATERGATRWEMSVEGRLIAALIRPDVRFADQLAPPFGLRVRVVSQRIRRRGHRFHGHAGKALAQVGVGHDLH